MSRLTFTGRSRRPFSLGRPMDEDSRASTESSSPPRDRFIRFEPYRFDRIGGLLSRNGIETVLPPRAARLLGCLLENSGNVVPRDVLIAAVWNEVAVSDQSLAEAVSQVRHALEDDPSSPTYIQTVHRRGYRFVAPVAIEQHDVSPGNGLAAVAQPASAAQAAVPGPTRTEQRRRLHLLAGITTLAVLVVGGAFLVRAWFTGWAEDLLEEQQRELAKVEDGLMAVQQRVFGSDASSDLVWEQASITIYGASPSPSGEYISYGGAGSAPSLYRIDTGETISLAQEENPPVGWVATSPVFSPDSRRIAYLFNDEMGVSDPALRIVEIEDGEVVTLPRGSVAIPHAWTPDGNQLVAVRPSESALEIVLVSVEDGAMTTLKTLDGRFADRPWRVSLSPDGQAIAYDFKQADGSGQRDIHLLSLHDRGESLAVEHSVNDLLLMWTPDGTGILFISNRSGNYAAWLVGVADGKVEGSPDRIREGGSSIIWPLGLTRDGSLFYGVGSGPQVGSDLYIAALEPRTLRASGAPVKVLPSFPGLNLGPTWSPDGNQVAYLSQRGLLFELDTVIVVSSVTGNQARRREEFKPGLRYIRGARWSPDGLKILVHGCNAGMVWGLYLVDVATGEAAILQDSPGRSADGARWLPDGRRIVYGRSYHEPMDDPATGETKVTGVQTLLLRELDGDVDRELHRNVEPKARESWALSPDGRDLAVSLYVPEDDSYKVVLQLIPLAGGPPEEILSVSPPFTISNLAWAPGGERILFVRKRGDLAEERQIWAVSLETGEAEPLGISLPGIRNMAFDPAGARIAFVASTQAPSAEVWVLRNFLPEPSATGDEGGPASGRPSRR